MWQTTEVTRGNIRHRALDTKSVSGQNRDTPSDADLVRIASPRLHRLLYMVCIRSIIAPRRGLGEVADIVELFWLHFGELCMSVAACSQAWLNPLCLCIDLRFAAVLRFIKMVDICYRNLLFCGKYAAVMVERIKISGDICKVVHF